MFNKIHRFLWSSPNFLKLGILAILIYLSVDNFIPNSSGFPVALGKATLIGLMVLILGYLFIKPH